ncbi:hypothetical protein BD770DRAFT_300121, partial [Pilaira anomala]
LYFQKTTTSFIRLVVLDYAGLCTNPMGVCSFVKQIETDLTIEQIVIDHGHRLD